MRLNISVILYCECNQWIAHCLEFDLLGSGSTREAALEDLMKVIVFQGETNLDNLFFPAPGGFFRKFAEGIDVVINLKLHIERLSVIEGIVVRECVDLHFSAKP